MIFKSIRIKEGLFERNIVFSNKVNMIFSKKNSRGKTTLLRFLLYSLGYNIPNTKKFKFSNCEVETNIESETVGSVVLFRTDKDFVDVVIDGNKQTYILPEQQDELHEKIFGTANKDVLNNLLGAFYADQEKGWTLLNRGTVIGSIRFNIEELIRGLSGRDCGDLIKKEGQLSRELNKYRQMFSVAKYRESVIADSGSLIQENYTEISNTEIEQLLLQQKSLKKELNRIDRTINDNKHFKRFIGEMKLLVMSDDGKTIPVTENNVVGLNDTIDFLVAKRKLISAQLAIVAKGLLQLQKKTEIEEEQLSFFESEDLIEIFDKKIAAVPINAVAIDKEIKRLEKSLKAIRHEITFKTKQNNSVVTSLYNGVIKYATELGVGDEESITSSYLFTSNLKELSGAVLHKTVFAFRLAYIIEIEKLLGIKLPIILDSPSGKEVDQENIQLMVNILNRDFVDNQIIIASIYKYAFDEVNTIEIINRLVE